MSRGHLIAFEGIDGAGKTTQVERLAEWLRVRGREVVTTREPTDGPEGARIRELSAQGIAISPEQRLHCFMEDRRAHVRDLIQPALSAGQTVITDRYFLSNVAYQGAEGLDSDDILRRNEAAFPIPTAVLLIELPVALGLERVRARGGNLNLAFEREDFLQRVTRIFDSIERDYLFRIPGEASPEQVHASVLAVVQE